MDLFTEDDLREIVSVQSEYCISLYMPSFRTGTETQQNPIRFKNLISEAEEKLVASGQRPTEAASLLDSIRRFLNNRAFWQYQAEGLAAFVAPGILKIYRLPVTIPQMAIIGPRFHLKPLLHLLTGDTRFFLLDLNTAGIRLYTGTRFMFTRIESDKLPLGMDETLQFDTMEKQQQFSSKPQMNENNRTTVFGYGRLTDKRKVYIMHYYHRVNDAIKELLQNTNAPLITIGIDYLHSLYREANSYPYLIEQGIMVDPQDMSDDEIYRRVWPAVEPLFEKTQKRDTAVYKQLAGEHNSTAVNDLKTIVSGSLHGRIGTLFVQDSSTTVWGKFRPDKDDVDLHEDKLPDDEDLLDKAAINTMLRGGVVYLLKPEQMPDSSKAAAILRY